MERYLKALDYYTDLKIKYSDLDLNEFRNIDFKKELEKAKDELAISLLFLIRQH